MRGHARARRGFALIASDTRGMLIAEPRAMCETCGRPRLVCWCGHVRPLTTKTRVVILQHPRERKVPINTARIAARCLPGAELHVGIHFPDPAVLGDPERPAALLYPGEGAIDVEENPPKGPITLVVVDGTWWQAKKLVNQNPALKALPRYAFRPHSPSNYRIRREPHEDYVSTIEALVHMLSVLEGDDRFLTMLDPFRAMVDAQLAFVGKNSRPRHAKKTPKIPVDPRTRIPVVLRERFEDLVCVHAEANAWPYAANEKDECPDELVQWTACRPATGESFDFSIAPRLALAPSTTKHTEISESEILAGGSVEDLIAKWNAFAKPTDVICGWGTYSIGLFQKLGAALPDPKIDLRRTARVFLGAPVGTMHDFRAKMEMKEPASRARGRAGRRLAELEAIVRFLSK